MQSRAAPAAPPDELVEATEEGPPQGHYLGSLDPTPTALCGAPLMGYIASQEAPCCVPCRDEVVKMGPTAFMDWLAWLIEARKRLGYP